LERKKKNFADWEEEKIRTEEKEKIFLSYLKKKERKKGSQGKGNRNLQEEERGSPKPRSKSVRRGKKK